jgi:hypothetical protein
MTTKAEQDREIDMARKAGTYGIEFASTGGVSARSVNNRPGDTSRPEMDLVSMAENQTYVLDSILEKVRSSEAQRVAAHAELMARLGGSSSPLAQDREMPRDDVIRRSMEPLNWAVGMGGEGSLR